MQAFDALKGAGQITEIEGTKATEAVGRLDTAMGPVDYVEALNEVRDILKKALDRAAPITTDQDGYTIQQMGQ